VLLLASVSWIIATLLHPNNFALNAVLDPFWVPAHVTEGLANLLLVFGLVGLYLRQADRAGRLGLIGFLLALFGSAALVNTSVLFEVFMLPFIAAQQSAPKSAFDLIDPAGPLAGALWVSTAGSVASGVGFILTAIATVRAGVLPRWPGLLLITGLVLATIGLMIPRLWFFLNVGGVVSGSGMAGLGYALWSKKITAEAPAQIPSAT